MSIWCRLVVVGFGLVAGACSTPEPSSQPRPAPQRAGALNSAGTSAIAVNRFEVVHELEGDRLRVSLDTDLPDFAGVVVSVSRSYFEKGSGDELSRDYFNESSSVGRWRKPRAINVSHEIFFDRLQRQQGEMASVGLGAPLDRIVDDVAVSFTLHMRQTNKAFGEANANLGGTAAVALGKGKVARAEVKVPFAIGKSASSKPGWANGTELVAGRTYELPISIPLMPELEPRGLDPTLNAIAARRTVPAGGTIKVEALAIRSGVRWYRVSAADASGRPSGRGWVNSDALIGQPLRTR